eukprot:1869012-Prymnesium_polylepis.1
MRLELHSAGSTLVSASRADLLIAAEQKDHEDGRASAAVHVSRETLRNVKLALGMPCSCTAARSEPGPPSSQISADIAIHVPSS